MPFPGATRSDRVSPIFGHLAVQPAPIAGLPPFLWRVLARLLAKEVDQRYQTAAAVLHDLQLLTDGATTEGLAAGGADRPCGTYVPRRLYGRADEVRTELALLERTAHGAPQLLLLAGDSGMGKTAIVRETMLPRHALVQARPQTQSPGRPAGSGAASAVLFFSGKFDLSQTSEPFAAWAQIFNKIVDFVLSQPDGALKERLVNALGPQAVLLTGALLLRRAPEGACALPLTAAAAAASA